MRQGRGPPFEAGLAHRETEKGESLSKVGGLADLDKGVAVEVECAAPLARSPGCLALHHAVRLSVNGKYRVAGMVIQGQVQQQAGIR